MHKTETEHGGRIPNGLSEKIPGPAHAIKTIAHMTSLHANELFKWVCGQVLPKDEE